MNFFIDLIPFEERINQKQLLINQQIVNTTHSPQPLRIKTEQLSSKSHQAKNVWKTVESKRYIAFLKKKGYLYDLSTLQKKKIKVNVQMSNTIKTRTPIQCHSHHQKMIKKYGTIKRIIQSQTLQFLNLGSKSQSRQFLSPNKEDILLRQKGQINRFYLKKNQSEMQKQSYFYADST